MTNKEIKLELSKVALTKCNFITSESLTESVKNLYEWVVEEPEAEVKTIDKNSFDSVDIKEVLNIVRKNQRSGSGICSMLEKQGEQNLANSAKPCKDEQKPTNNQFTPEQASVLDKHIDKFLEQNPTWSEEDETKIKSIIAFLKSPSLCAMDGNKGIIDESIKYLNSLKDKVQPQPKQEWSEEDEKNIRLSTDIINSALHAGFCVKLDRDRCVDWIKSLKDRYTWKPSGEQNIYKNGVYQETNGVRIWHNGHTFLVPKDWNKGKWPLLNKKGEENSKKNKEHLMNEIDALLDWDFVAATKHIQDLGTDIPLKDEEYLITAPVWLAMYEHRIALNKALSNIGAMEIDFNKDFWFAQRSSVGYAWFFYGTSRILNNNYAYYTSQVGAVSL